MINILSLLRFRCRFSLSSSKYKRPHLSNKLYNRVQSRRLCRFVSSFNAIFVSSYCCKFMHLCIYFQVQIQGQQQGQMLSQVLQVPAGSHQQLQGVTTAQLIQPGELTEEQHQQVWKDVLFSQNFPISLANTFFSHLSCRPS